MSKTVLVIEDNEMNMKLFCDVLESCGHQTLRAYSGMAGLELARSRKLDLIVLDIQLPDMSGLEVARTMKTHRLMKLIPIIAVTAFAMPGDEENIRAAGCDDYMKKPIQVSEFLAVIGKILGEPEAETQANNARRDSDDKPGPT